MFRWNVELWLNGKKQRFSVDAYTKSEARALVKQAHGLETLRGVPVTITKGGAAERKAME